MALLTPPHTSHRSDKDKENKFEYAVAGPSTRSVVWAEETSIHDLSTPIKPISLSSKKRPAGTKSILKKATAYNSSLDVPTETVKPREITPQPVDPLVNLHYLDRPVSQIIAEVKERESVSDLIEGYNVLALRLRTSVSDSIDSDASWPLFQPLRKNKEVFIDAVVRDLGRALVDPMLQCPSEQSPSSPAPKFTPPSPKSPMKKRDGMTAEQVKYARDLCTICHSVLKMLGVAFSYSAIFSIFDEQSLRRVLAAVLAIPMADSLPTPNARKTCALAIWLIQVQRLPAEVVRPAADRIAYALRRGLDGELGKEGKKGSINDGLKAIHDLCVFQPDVFTSAFVCLLPSILSNLLAGQLVIRTQACHALGGFVIGATSVPLSEMHTRISNIVANFLTTLASPSKSPSKSVEPLIIRTLRTTLSNPDPQHVAQGPVWGLSVLASFSVLLHSRLCTDVRVNKVIINLLNIALKSKKGSIRSLCHLVWRPLTWVYFQPPLPSDSDEESEIDDEEQMVIAKIRKVYWQVVSNVIEYRTGVSTVAALLGEAPDSEENVREAIVLLRNMASKAGSTCPDAVDTVHQMVSMSSSKSSWDSSYLIPPSLFSSSPGILTADLKGANSPLQTIFEEVAAIDDVRCLTRDEIAKPWVFKGLISIWWSALSCLQLGDSAEVPTPLVEIWERILTHRVSFLEENEEGDSVVAFANQAIQYVIEVLEQPDLNFVFKHGRASPAPDLMTATMEGSDDAASRVDPTEFCTNGELRLRVVRTLWIQFKKVFPDSTISEAAEKLLVSMMRNHLSILGPSALLSKEGSTREARHGKNVRDEWVGLMMDILSVCDVEAMKVFWGLETDGPAQSGTWGSSWSEAFKAAVWKAAVECWRAGDYGWESAIVILSVPFTDRHAWDVTGDDFTFWSEFFESYVVSKALDYGVESYAVVDKLTSFVLDNQTPGHVPGALRFVEYLLSYMDPQDMREVPANLLDLVSQTMHAAYPPESRKMQIASWLMRSLSSLIEGCPDQFIVRVLEILEEPLVLWIQDEWAAWTADLAAYDTDPLYQHILIRIQGLPATDATLEKFGSLIGSIFCHRVPPVAMDAFKDFWKLTYGTQGPPKYSWPEPIHKALVAVGIMDSIPAPPCTPIAASFSTPPTAVVKREALAQIGSPQRPTKPVGAFPIVPTSPETPIRRRRTSSGGTHGVINSGGVRRTPLSSLQLCNTGSPSKRRKIAVVEDEEGKENIQIPSVLERIASLSAINGKKRRFEDDGDDDELLPARAPTLPSNHLIPFPTSDSKEAEVTPMKNLKKKMRPRSSKPLPKKARITSPTQSNTSTESEEERKWVEQSLLRPAGGLPFPSVEADAEEDVHNPSAPIRVRTVATSEQSAPSLRDEEECQPSPRLERATSFPQNSSPKTTTPSTPVRKIDLTKYLAQRRSGTLRRSVSVPDSIRSGCTDDLKKRKRVDSLDDEAVEELLNTTTPLPALSIQPLDRKPLTPWWMRKMAMDGDVEMVGSDDSDTTIVAGPASSDDDPHLGQVTPHHLISPDLVRKKQTMTSISSLRLKGLHVAAPLVKPAFPFNVSKELFGEDDESDVPGSDDSLATSGSETDSPTKMILLRHIQKTSSPSSFVKGSPASRTVSVGF
ncbi:hypothetical protein CVT24_003715 [Panaeolus cyanescens]|uniref:Telomere-associated protein Rif1 N-terminal domain-containing protein n=1 Tax=Panaeolus cyanescens TaxID=181874 RepID=A0A409YXJ6_9AGAR|nr:hypothetical protein CVT24_003715 [Panaeolus cyanescens]